MSHQFKPGDLAIIIAAQVMVQNIGACCELVSWLNHGDDYVAPNGRESFNSGVAGWLVVGDSVVGRAMSAGGVIEETPGFGIVKDEWLMPLRGDFDFAKELELEVAHG